MRRNRRSVNISSLTQDPGKDLFAYLFLLIMVFSFMLLMSVEQSRSSQDAPEQQSKGKSSFSQVVEDHIARLEERDGKLLLRFGNTVYDPVADVEKLEQDNRLKIKTDGEKTQKILYIEQQDNAKISLFDYLDTFKVFSEHSISIAFVKVMS